MSANGTTQTPAAGEKAHKSQAVELDDDNSLDFKEQVERKQAYHKLHLDVRDKMDEAVESWNRGNIDIDDFVQIINAEYKRLKKGGLN